MTYHKPEVVMNGTAISAIEAGFMKDVEIGDSGADRTAGAYASDE